MCPFCLADMHSFCADSCACHLQERLNEREVLIVPSDDDDNDRYATSGRGRGNSTSSSRTGKRTSSLKDQQSTGRKRAAKLYPLERNKPCEWNLRSNCGGGPYPILGCINGLQEARHHGPDKNVSNNEEGNVHRICHRCHYNWHARNDGEYDWKSTEVQAHSPKPMNDEQKGDAVMIDLKFLANKSGRTKIKD